MTVKEMLSLLEEPKEVNLSWNGDLVYFNFRNRIEVDVWGDFLVDHIVAMKEAVFELVLKVDARPIKKGVSV